MIPRTKLNAASLLAMLFLAGAGQEPPALIALPVTPQTVISGIVKSASGEALGGAEVLLATPKKKVDVYSTIRTGAASTQSADDGSFSFDVPDGPCEVVVRHRLGYAQVTREQLEANNQVALEPWSRVEGVVKIGSVPAGGVTVLLDRYTDWQNPYGRLIQHERQTKTDAQGRYSFDQVVPGDTWISRRADPQGYIAALEYVDVQSGKTVKVALGGRGQPVIGRVMFPKGSDEKFDWKFGRGSTMIAGRMPARMPLIPTHPKDASDQSWEQQRILTQAWNRSPQGQFAKRNNFGVSFWVNPNGTFRLDDVPTGTHSLSVMFYHEDPGADYVERIAEFETTITIPDLSAVGGQTDKPLDQGTIVMNMPPRLRIGQAAPAMTLKKLDGAEVKLSDFAGKFVLLVPWAEQRKVSDEDIASIKLAHEKHAKGGKLVILTVDFNGDADSAQRLAKTSGLSELVIQCTGQFSRGTLPDLLAGKYVMPQEYFQAPSLITLIDPDGKIAAKNLAGENIEGAVYRGIFAR